MTAFTYSNAQREIWVVITSPRGAVRQKAALSKGLDPRVISARRKGVRPESS